MAAKWQQNGINSTKFPGFQADWQVDGNKMATKWQEEEKRKWRGKNKGRIRRPPIRLMAEK
jgi:hypothetical protein